MGQFLGPQTDTMGERTNSENSLDGRKLINININISNNYMK